MKSPKFFVSVSLAAILIGALVWHFSKKPAESAHHHEDAHATHAMHHNSNEKEIELFADIPIYQPSEATFKNRLNFLTSENVYIRYNTAGNKMEEVTEYYVNALPAGGWIINPKKSNSERFVFQKDGYHATLRIFEMQQSDTSSTAFSVNVVRPK